jgi:hypothetical protein
MSETARPFTASGPQSDTDETGHVSSELPAILGRNLRRFTHAERALS